MHPRSEDIQGHEIVLAPSLFLSLYIYTEVSPPCVFVELTVLFHINAFRGQVG